MRSLTVIFILLCSQAIGQVRRITLNDAISIAVENNSGLKASEQQIPEAQGDLKANVWPQNLWLGLDYEDSPGDFGERIFYIEQQAEFPLRYWYKYNAYKSQVNTAEADYSRDALYLKAAARNAYISWLSAFTQLQVDSMSFALADSFRNTNERLYKAGEVSRIVSTRAKLNLSQATLNYDLSRINELTRRNELLTILNLPAETALQPQDSMSLYMTSAEAFSIQGYDSTFQADILLSQKNVDQSKAFLAYQRSGWLPDVSVKYFRSIESANGGIGLGIGIPIWIFSQQGAVQRAKANLKANEFLYQQTKLNLDNRVKAIQSILLEQKGRMGKYESLLSESLLILSDSKRAFEAGEIDYIQYLDAQQAYFQAKKQLLQLQQRYLIQLTDMYVINGAF